MEPSEQGNDERRGKPSASGFDRIARCPGSFLAERDMPDDRDDWAKSQAEYGTDVHELMELNETAEEVSKEEMADRLRRIELAVLTEWGDRPYSEAFREKRLWLRDQVSAKCDVVYLTDDGERALIIDYKTGFLKVKAQNNWQLKVQASCLFDNVNDDLEYSLREVTVAVAMAATGVHYEKAIITFDEHQVNETKILATCYEAMEPDARRFAGDWCSYCRARSVCPQAMTFAMVAAAAEKNGGLTSPKTLAALHLARKPIWKILDAVKARLMEMTDGELAAIGLKRKPGWATNEYAVGPAWILLREMGLRADEFKDCCEINYGKLEEIMVQKITAAQGGTQLNAKKALRKLLDPVSTKHARAPSIVAADSDPRAHFKIDDGGGPQETR